MFQDTLETKNKNFLENFLILENEIPKTIVFSYFYDENDNFEKLIVKLKNQDFLNEETIELLLNSFKKNNTNQSELLKEYKNFIKKLIPQKFNENDLEEINLVFNQI